MTLLRFLLVPLTFACLMLHVAALADEAAALSAALEDARSNEGIPFNLNVECTNADSRGSLAVLNGQIAVWNRTRQIALTTSERIALLDELINADFAHFDARYGETGKADKQEAPLRVSCRIVIKLGDLEKSSIQLLDGEQSKELLGLAGNLLDRVGRLVDRGVDATSLEDGLAKLDDGILAPEVLELRLVTIPTGADGSILRVEGAAISRQPYTPGQSVGVIDSSKLTPDEFDSLVTALREASVWRLPVNLAAKSLIELEVSVLGQRKSVVARPSFRPATAEMQSDFGKLLEQLEQL